MIVATFLIACFLAAVCGLAVRRKEYDYAAFYALTCLSLCILAAPHH